MCGYITRSLHMIKTINALMTLIRDSYVLSGGVCGYRLVHGYLSEIGETCGKNRVGRLMQLHRIKAVRTNQLNRVSSSAVQEID